MLHLFTLIQAEGGAKTRSLTLPPERKAYQELTPVLLYFGLEGIT